MNLIPYNNTYTNDFKRSDTKTIKFFKEVLQKKEVNVTVRTSLGGDIAAACRQIANN